MCPNLPPPTKQAVEALKKAGSWVIDLEKHYQKLDKCPVKY